MTHFLISNLYFGFSDLPSIHALNDLLPEDLIKSIAQSWKKFISSKEVCLESNISQILSQGIEFLLQVTDGIQVSF